MPTPVGPQGAPLGGLAGRCAKADSWARSPARRPRAWRGAADLDRLRLGLVSFASTSMALVRSARPERVSSESTPSASSVSHLTGQSQNTVDFTVLTILAERVTQVQLLAGSCISVIRGRSDGRALLLVRPWPGWRPGLRGEVPLPRCSPAPAPGRRYAIVSTNSPRCKALSASVLAPNRRRF